jgi:DNA repair protein RadC
MMIEPKNTSPLHFQDGQWVITLPLDDASLARYAQKILQHRFEQITEPLTDVDQIKDYLKATFQPYEREVFTCLFLDGDFQIIAIENLFYTSIGNTVGAPRTILRAALRYNSASIILIHNQPSGMTKPTPSDITTLLNVQEICEQLGICLLDHFVIGKQGIFSHVESGHMKLNF